MECSKHKLGDAFYGVNYIYNSAKKKKNVYIKIQLNQFYQTNRNENDAMYILRAHRYMCATSNISLHVKSLLTQLILHGVSNWDIHSSNFLHLTVKLLDICLYTYTHKRTYIPSHFTSEKGEI